MNNGTYTIEGEGGTCIWTDESKKWRMVVTDAKTGEQKNVPLNKVGTKMILGQFKLSWLVSVCRIRRDDEDGVTLPLEELHPQRLVSMWKEFWYITTSRGDMKVDFPPSAHDGVTKPQNMVLVF